MIILTAISQTKIRLTILKQSEIENIYRNHETKSLLIVTSIYYLTVKAYFSKM
jgi:hypothetical protein